MRSSDRTVPKEWDEYTRVLYIVCASVVSISNGMSVSFLYQSAKDVLKWNNLSARMYIGEVMSIGNLIHLTDKDYQKVKSKSESDITAQDIADTLRSRKRQTDGND